MDQDQEELDPRVQVELERLNTSTDEINRLESQLEEANNMFRATLSESSAQLKALSKKVGSCIEKARPYYESVEGSRISQMDCQRAAVQYQRANALHAAAKETISLAEERFIKCKDENWQFDSAWQEMLNHATIKVMEAEAQKAASEREHMKRASAYSQMQLRVQQLQRGLKSAIYKSRIYFDQKAQVQAQLNSQKEHVQQLQRSITANKTIYAQTLRSLEQISEEIHEARRCRLPREPGVGAELSVPTASDISHLRRHNSAINLHSALEEQTAQEEKYWESLREKLEEMKTSDQEPLEAGSEEITMDYLDCRQRSLTGSSAVEEDLERVVSGESETEDKSEPEDKSDCEEIRDLSISLENVNLYDREHGVGSENDIFLTEEGNSNKNDIYKLRKDSNNVWKVDIGNEKDSKCGCEALSNVIMNKGLQECDTYSSGSGSEDLSCHRDLIDIHQQESMRTSPLGVTFTCKTPDIYPSQCEYEEIKANLDSNKNVNRFFFRTNQVIFKPDICHSDVLLNKDTLTCDTLDNDKDQSASEGCIEDSDPHINSLSNFSNEFQEINDNGKQNAYEACVLSEKCTIATSNDEYVSDIKDQSSFLINNGNESNNELGVSYNNGNTSNYNDNVSQSPNPHVRSPVIMCKPKAGLAVIPEH